MSKDAKAPQAPPPRMDAARSREYLDRFACVTPEDWDVIIKAAVAGARKGDKVDRQWLATYVCPDPSLLMQEGRAPGAINILITSWTADGKEEVRPLLPGVPDVAGGHGDGA